MDGILIIAGLVALLIIPAFMSFEIDEFAGKLFSTMHHVLEG